MATDEELFGESVDGVTGFYVLPAFANEKQQASLVSKIAEAGFFAEGKANQVMLWGQDALNLACDFLNILSIFGRESSEPAAKILQDFLTAPHRLQCIVNLYLPGEGISPHVDLPHRYGPHVIGLSLLSSATFDLYNTDETSPCYSAHLQPGDVYILTGSARYDHKHAIAARLEDMVPDEQGRSHRVLRRLRVSLTLRRSKDEADDLNIAM